MTKPSNQNKSWAKSTILQLVSLCYLLFVCVCIFVFNMPYQVLAIYLLMSLISFLQYWRDKRAAEKAGWRTSENTLHLSALLGGWPGALFAQQTLRHKSKKVPFRILLWITIIINITAFVWALTPNGMQFVQKWLADVSMPKVIKDIVPTNKKPFLNITPMN